MLDASYGAFVFHLLEAPKPRITVPHTPGGPRVRAPGHLLLLLN